MGHRLPMISARNLVLSMKQQHCTMTSPNSVVHAVHCQDEPCSVLSIQICLQPVQVAHLQQECTSLEQLVEELETQLSARRSTDRQAHSSSAQQHLSAGGAHLTESTEGWHMLQSNMMLLIVTGLNLICMALRTHCHKPLLQQMFVQVLTG